MLFKITYLICVILENGDDMKYYNQDIKDVYQELETNENGLTDEEVKIRLHKNGFNILEEGKRRTKLSIFLKQFQNLMIILLLVVGVLSFLYALFGDGDYLDPIVILGCAFVNILMGYFQESKAEDAIEKLKQYTSTKVTVKRDGHQKEVDSKELAVGDILVLEAGDKIPADARVIDAMFAKVDESILTGESDYVSKSEEVLDGKKSVHEMKNMIFAGTSLVTGKIVAVVTSTGMNTEIGCIAESLNKSEEPITPLQVKVKKISTFISILAIFLVGFVLIFGLVKDYDVLSLIMLCISMIVASVPESLPIAITATLSIGVSAMAKKKAVVRNMAAIETLGATEVICSDKTGTITTNQMEVINIFADGKNYQAENFDFKNYPVFAKIMGLCSNVVLDDHKKYYGDAVEVAGANFLQKQGISKEELDEKYPRVIEIPFGSERKMMSSVNQDGDAVYLYAKGSLDSILKRSSSIFIDGKIRKITNEDKKMFVDQENEYSNQALKVIAFAYKKVDKKVKDDEDYPKEENDLVLVSLVGFKDPAHKDVKEAISKCMDAHIDVYMITGDNIETGCAIAKEVGIISSDNEGIELNSLKKFTQKEMDDLVLKYRVFARVTPEQKYGIIESLKRQGKVVAMTGDGVNDAPAMRIASVAVGMGKNGTDVTKNVADILLLDDSFSTIVKAVDEGRRIYDNVISNVLYNLSSNFTEIVIIIIGMFLSQNIILPLHVLYIDLVADTVPSIMLAFEGASKNNMKRKPNGINKPIFTPYFLAFLIASVIVEAGISMIVYSLFIHESVELAQTLALLSIVINEFIFAYNCRSLKEQIKDRGFFSNKYLNIGIFILLGIQLLVFLTPIGKIFSLTSISIGEFIFVIIINIFSFAIIEIFKPLLSKFFKDE